MPLFFPIEPLTNYHMQQSDKRIIALKFCRQGKSWFPFLSDGKFWYISKFHLNKLVMILHFIQTDSYQLQAKRNIHVNKWKGMSTSNRRTCWSFTLNPISNNIRFLRIEKKARKNCNQPSICKIKYSNFTETFEDNLTQSL